MGLELLGEPQTNFSPCVPRGFRAFGLEEGNLGKARLNAGVPLPVGSL